MQWRIKKIPEYFAEILQFDLSLLTILSISQISLYLINQVDHDKEKLYEEAFLDIFGQIYKVFDKVVTSLIT